MEVAGRILLLLLLPSWHATAALGAPDDATLMHITRQNAGDVFHPEGREEERCAPERCIGLSSGTAGALSGGPCKCQCHAHLPAFREDLRICVDDIHECVLAPFVGGSTSQQIPFVFLPLKGQIIHPSKEISFTGIHTPVCAVSGAKFLSEAGWVELRNPVDTDVPFRLFRDEGRTFLQWVGEAELRAKMAGRLVLVYLMCRELATAEPVPSKATLFSPCVAFRVVGSPTKYLNNVSEVAFFPDAHSTPTSDHLSVSEYVAIGICSILLGLIYVASVFLYLHLRKRNKMSTTSPPKLDVERSPAGVDEGVVKNNPLLSMVAHFQPPDTVYSDSTGSDTDVSPDVQHNEERKKTQPLQLTSAQIHPPTKYESSHQDLMSSGDKHPEENVSIVETLDSCRDDLLNRIDCVKALTAGTIRKKLYFNPAYFEPQLLLAPPPAAIEFLSKIREVITIAKQKMDTKRFAPSLMAIAEEDHTYTIEYDDARASVSRRSSMISLKRENSRRKTCTGCPGCEPQLCGKLPEFPALAACHSCVGDVSKQRSIRKWLEDVPTLKGGDYKARKRLRSPARSLPPTEPRMDVSPTRPASERARKTQKARAPPPPPKMNFPPPDMIQEAMAMDSKEVRIPTLTKRQMKAVINEFASRQMAVDYEADSLERAGKGFCTPTEYGDLGEEEDVSQPSPSLSNALPMDEEMTMQNAIINTKTGSMTISKISGEQDDGHDYELIVLKKGGKEGLYKLPELLMQRANGGYSLVSEVYVNNGYNYNSAPSTPSDSNCSTLDKVRYEEGVERPGKLLIEVADCADNYIPVDDSDGFEPDTLDRKPSKIKINNMMNSLEERNHPTDQILLRTTGSFKKSPHLSAPASPKFVRGFGSLREIYEAKAKSLQCAQEEEGRLLTLEERHSKRQRRLVPPDVVPPPIYEQPKPPRKVDVPAKNGDGRSANRSTVGSTPAEQRRPEDSGYLSDSVKDKESESEEGSLDGDDDDESGAESVETHSVFFGTFRQPPNYAGFGSIDSGVDGGDLSSYFKSMSGKSAVFTKG